VCVLQTIPSITITGGLPTSALPLTAVISFDGLLTAIEDWRRHAADEQVNSRRVTRLGASGWEDVQSRDVRVGDRIKIRSGDVVPADCVLLAAKHETEEGDHAVCFVKTDQLDGESNLKLKRTPRPVADQLVSHSRLLKFQGFVECGPPEADFNRFRGNIVVPIPADAEFTTSAHSSSHLASPSGPDPALPPGVHSETVGPDALAMARRLAKRSDSGEESCKRFAVGAEALLLRGTEVRGVEHAVGLVVYTGNECKIRVQAAKKPRPKSPLMERQMNLFLVGIMVAQLAVCLIGAAIDSAFVEQALSSDYWYLGLRMGGGGARDAGAFVARSATFFLLTAQFIPVSLYVSIRGARQIQQLVMQMDRAMAYRLEGTAAAAAVADRTARRAAEARARDKASGGQAQADERRASHTARQTTAPSVTDWPEGKAPSRIRASGDGGAAPSGLPPSPLSPAHPDSLHAARRMSGRRETGPRRSTPHPADSPSPARRAPTTPGSVVSGIRVPSPASSGAGGAPHDAQSLPNPLSSPAAGSSERRLLDGEDDDPVPQEARQRLTAARTVSGTRRTDTAAMPPSTAGAAGHAAAAGGSAKQSPSGKPAVPYGSASGRAVARGPCCGCCGQGGIFECCAPGPEARVLGGRGICMAPVYSLFDDAPDPTAEAPPGGGTPDPPPTIWPTVRTMELNDELGQVTHVFSDKTGTLTRNSFEFRKLSIAGVEYGRGTTTIGLARLRRSATSDDSSASAGAVSAAERVLEEGERAVRPLPHVNFLDGVALPAGGGDSTARSLAADLGVPASAHDGGGSGSYGSTGSSAPPSITHEWLAAAGAGASGSGKPCPGSGWWAGSHVSLGAPAGGTASRPSSAALRLADMGTSDGSGDGASVASSAGGRGGPGAAATPGPAAPAPSPGSSRGSSRGTPGASGSPSAIASVVSDAGARPIGSLSPDARAALGVELRHFFLNLALDHSVELESRKDDDGNVTSVGLSASSPDEEAFVAMAALAGWEFVGRSKGLVRLLLPDGSTRPYATVAELPYTQARRMMSVIVRMPDAPAGGDDAGWADRGLGRGKYALYCKGADSRIAGLAAGYADDRGVARAAGVPEGAVASRIEQSAKHHNDAVSAATDGHMNAWAADGLRTLAFAWRPIPRDWMEEDCGVGAYEQWRARCESARGSAGSPPATAAASSSGSSGRVGWLRLWELATQDLGEKAKKERGEPNAIDDAMAVIERALRIQGATGIEDRLQAGVPEAVAALRDAGMKVYMLTGDKRATAENIGYAVQLLTEEHELVQLTKDKLLEDSEEARAGGAASSMGRFGSTILTPPRSGDAADVDSWLAAVVRDQLDALDPGREGAAERDRPLALVLDDPVLAALMGEKGWETDEERSSVRVVARRVMEAAESVVCCRCSPSHKKAVVQLIKYGPNGGSVPDKNVTTLAIGDGANDVEMIMEAAVGVGVQGAEGAQAANSADYAIGQFRFLQRLLLVHGRWNYRRMAYLVMYSLYKNFQFTFVTYFMQAYMGFSGQKVIVEAAIQTFNLVYVAFPIVWAAVLDQDLDQDSAQRFPFAYREGLVREHMRPWRLAAWAAAGVWEGAVIAFGLALWVGAGSTPAGWSMMDIFSFGQAAFTAMILLLNVQVALAVGMHHWSFQLITTVSAVLWIPAALVFDSLNADGTRGAVPLLFSSVSFWAVQVLLLALAILPMAILRAVSRTLYPSFARLALEAQILFRRGAHDSTFLVDRFDQDGDKWARRPGFETEPEPACGCSSPGMSRWEAASMQFRKFPFAEKIAAARHAAKASGASASEISEVESEMRERIDRVFVGRGWSKGCAVPGAPAVHATRSPLESVMVGPQ